MTTISGIDGFQGKSLTLMAVLWGLGSGVDVNDLAGALGQSFRERSSSSKPCLRTNNLRFRSPFFALPPVAAFSLIARNMFKLLFGPPSQPLGPQHYYGDAQIRTSSGGLPQGIQLTRNSELHRGPPLPRSRRTRASSISAAPASTTLLDKDCRWAAISMAKVIRPAFRGARAIDYVVGNALSVAATIHLATVSVASGRLGNPYVLQELTTSWYTALKVCRTSKSFRLPPGTSAAVHFRDVFYRRAVRRGRANALRTVKRGL
mmetsp:Transcript_14822/g.37817  ORF Transcript_14822/g.37817 Transcript_14822/m.37817 type:complete len:262 (+) Transcript_14822:66-851(+)|eukprot:CAMPEP_0174909874 /NCGR_PEP_ID=MMETSP0167-20121228/70474_1 /TAXON_ID=38298 /ORGANISM="Rhodella maculata, Strain CCMP736" /LENGTH=261 /DNA_ID=CAMNT_0016153987 /DNA_START=44 /DNA_END=829 /DNA_ORIENTATION=-